MFYFDSIENLSWFFLLSETNDARIEVVPMSVNYGNQFQTNAALLLFPSKNMFLMEQF